MAETTAIAWTRSSWNPWIGCTAVSIGCDHCYADAMDQARFSKTLGGGTKDKPVRHFGSGAPRYRTNAANWKAPLRWNKTAAATGERWTVFPSLCDPFDNEVPEEWRNDFWALVNATPYLTYLLLTKRIGNARKMLQFSQNDDPMPNVWLGASVVNQDEADRDIPKLLATPAAKRFVSYEPALGPVDFSPYLAERTEIEGVQDERYRIDWIIVGGESSQGGAKARPFDIDWARSTIMQCKGAGVPVFVKQVGSNPVWGDEASSLGRALREGGYTLKDRAGADPSEWPDDLRVQEFPT